MERNRTLVSAFGIFAMMFHRLCLLLGRNACVDEWQAE